ncbi:MAG: DNA-formamidopyrimidine glycosylase family protein [Methanomicrobiaceae archaeon]|nr:DNA-formamidopyrimidine glycosylase family protein [Methanomicrobiaceae archaeon]
MPELPDVEYYRIYLNATALHKTIERVEVRAPRILEEVTERRLRSALAGRAFASTSRHGKYLFAAIDGDADESPWLVMHFGMTGRVKYFEDAGQDPEHDRLLIGFENGYFLAFVNQRKFGHVALATSPEAFAKEKGLGPDALSVGREEFVARLGERRGSAKATLMNQKVLAGIGNIYADEILFQAGVHPKTPVRALDEDTRGKVHSVMGDVLHTAIAVMRRHDDFPDSYLIPHRHEGGVCPLDGTPLETVKISGRRAYFCPEHQSYGRT